MNFKKLIFSISFCIILNAVVLNADTTVPCFELLLVDSNGHRVGYDSNTGNTVSEIPDSAYGEDQFDEDSPIVKSLDFCTPPKGDYKLYLIGKSAGTYHITVSAYTTDANSADQTISGTISPGEIKQALVHYSPIVGEATQIVLVSTPSVTVSVSLADLSCYPNPFNPNRKPVTVQYSLRNADKVDMAIFDLMGNLVKTWAVPSGDNGAKAGLNQVTWDGRNGQGTVVANGGYIVSVTGDGKTKHFKLLVIK